MFCPKCRSEYVEGITHCTDCDTDLVYELPPETTPELPSEIQDWGRWTMIYSPSRAQELAMIKMILERENIPYFIGNELTRRAALYSPPDLAFELWVPDKFSAKAMRILIEELEIL